MGERTERRTMLVKDARPLLEVGGVFCVLDLSLSLVLLLLVYHSSGDWFCSGMPRILHLDGGLYTSTKSPQMFRTFCVSVFTVPVGCDLVLLPIACLDVASCRLFEAHDVNSLCSVSLHADATHSYHVFILFCLCFPQEAEAEKLSSKADIKRRAIRAVCCCLHG